MTEINGFDVSEFLCDESVLKDLEGDPFSNGTQELRPDSGFDYWIYPTNYPIRQYQFNIVQACLYKNTLVVLPTGLGKTFIAAVVMYNYFRWFPRSKIIFMAPTRPLVNQQIEACYNIVKIPKEDSVELTGRLNKTVRSQLWKTKRVFFCTPQVVEQDLHSMPDFPINDIKMIVIDEAHKATGKYAFVECVRNIYSRNKNFRVLALSATPGRNIENVSEVVRNLLISHVEIRCENSIDVSPYTHKKNIKTVVIPLGPELTAIKDKFIDILDPYVRKLLDSGVITGSTGSLSKNWLILRQQEFNQTSLQARPPNHSEIAGTFSICVSLYHALEVLERSGIQLFLKFFEDFNNKTEQKYFVAKDINLKLFLDELNERYRDSSPLNVSFQTLPNGQVPRCDKVLEYGHPKYEIIQKKLVEFFTAEENKNSSCMVFCELRETVLLTHSILAQKRPLIRPKVLVGQGSSAGIKAVSQKEQIAAIKDFKSGKSNVLIATCVGEEGLDIGEVNMIICMDITSRNPTRFVQRIGRTGRKRQGQVIMLVTEGKEQGILRDVLNARDKTNQRIAKSSEISRVLYKNCPRLVPPQFNPKCLETFIKFPEGEEENEGQGSKKGKKKNSKRKNDENDNQIDSSRPSTSKASTSKAKRKALGPNIQNYFNKFRKTSPESTPLLENNDDILESVSIINADKNTSISKAKPFEASEILLDTEFPIQLKKIVLSNDSMFVRTTIESMSVLEALQNDTSDYDAENIETIKRRLRALKQVNFSAKELKKIVKKKEEPKCGVLAKFNAFVKKGDTPSMDQEFLDKVKTKFESLLIKDVPIILERDPSPVGFFESQSVVPLEFQFVSQQIKYVENVSKYQDQIDSRKSLNNSNYNNEKNNIFNSTFKSSTPVRKSSSTPKNSKTKLKFSPQDSPLLRAFQRSINKKIESDAASSPTTSFNSPQSMTIHQQTEDANAGLKYFGLKSVDDIFASSSDEEPLYDDGKTTSKFYKNTSCMSPDQKRLQLPLCNLPSSSKISNSNQKGLELLQYNLPSTSKISNSNEKGLQLPFCNLPNDSKISNSNEKIINITESHKKSPLPTVVPEINETSHTKNVVNVAKNLESNPLEKQNTIVDVDEDVVPCSQEEEIDYQGGPKMRLKLLRNLRNCKKAPSNSKKSPSPVKQIKPLKDPVPSKCDDFFGFDEESDNFLSNIPLDSFPPKELKENSSNDADFEIDLNQSTYTITQILKKCEASEAKVANVGSVANENVNTPQKDTVKIDSEEEIECSQPEETLGPRSFFNKRKLLHEKSAKKAKDVNDVWDVNDVFSDNSNDKSNDSTKTVEYEYLEFANDSKASSLTAHDKGVIISSNEENYDSNNKSTATVIQHKSPSIFELAGSSGSVSKTPNQRKLLSLDAGTSKTKISFYEKLLTYRPSQSTKIGNTENTNKKNSPPIVTQSSPVVSKYSRPVKPIILSSDEETEDSEVFLSAKTTLSPKKIATKPKPKSKPRTPRSVGNKLNAKKKKYCQFLDSEAGFSGDDSFDDDEEHGLDQFIADSIICSQDPVDDPDIDMHAKYLESIKSPIGKRGLFKIPEPKKYNNVDIFSQMPSDDDESEDNSFVVDNEEEVAVETQMCELERAEAILKQRKREKRQQKLNPQANIPSTKKRRIIKPADDSSDDDVEIFTKKIKLLA